MKHRKNRHNGHSDGECNPNPQEVARRAYELYLERGGDPGHDFDDWLRAERELKEQSQVAMNH